MKHKMDFDDPGLEELIQNDLRTEMNKILSQSEVEELEAAATRGNSKSVHRSRTTPTGHQSRDEPDELKERPSVKLEMRSSPSTEGLSASDEIDSIDTTLIEDLAQEGQMQHTQQEMSDHFAIGSYVGFDGDIRHLPPEVTEHSDLSSLTWLTTVDVQALQKLTEQGTVITPAVIANQRNIANQRALSMQNAAMPMVSQPQLTVEQASVIHETPKTSQNGSAANAAIPQLTNQAPHTAGMHSATVAPTPHSRYAPIQPNYNPDNRRFHLQQRYQLQTHNAEAHNYGPNRIGTHRFVGGHVMGPYPYPPPPYANNGRGGFVPTGPMTHSRFHHHHHHPHVQPHKVYPKPVYSYSCLIAMALYNSKTGCLPVSDIYNYMMEKYPYFKTAPDGWKNSVRHNLSLNKCFEKVEKPNGSQRKGCLWALNPAKITKMKEEVQKWKRKDPESIRRSMSNPEELDRELEEMRRADEETARRRMLSMSSHGLTAPTLHMNPHHQHHPSSHHHLGQFHMQPHALPHHLTSPGAGPSSLPANPQRHPGQHFSTELAQRNFALTLARSVSQPAPETRNPFEFATMENSPQLPGLLNSINVGSNNNNNSFPTNGANSPEMIVLAAHGGQSAFFASPQSSSSSTSSGPGSLLGTMTEVTSDMAEANHCFADMDLDASLADLAVLQDSLWDGTLDSHPSSEVSDVFIERDEKQSTPTVKHEQGMAIPEAHEMLAPFPRVLSAQSQQDSPETPGYNASSERVDTFSRELNPFASNNIKPVVLL